MCCSTVYSVYMLLTREYISYVEYCHLDEVTFCCFSCDVFLTWLCFLVINYIECCSLQLWFRKYGGFIELVFCQCVISKFDILIRHF